MHIWLYSITPILGALRNYIKYKNIKFKTFIRTPLMYLFIHFMVATCIGYNIVMHTLIFERWFFFIYKSGLSIYNDDYHKKKEKYKLKYDMIYP